MRISDKNKKNARPKKLLLAPLILLSVLLIGMAQASASLIWPSASINIDSAKFKKAEVISTYIYNCIETGKLKKVLSTADQNSGEFIENDTDQVVSSFVQSDNKMKCSNMTQSVADDLYGGKTAMLQALYQLDTNGTAWYGRPTIFCNDSSIKDDTSDPTAVQSCTITMDKVIANLATKANEKGFIPGYDINGNPDLGPDYKWGVLNPLFIKCFSEVDTTNNTGPVDIDGTTYDYKIDKGTELSVGRLIEEDGVWTCEELATKLQSDDWSYITMTTEEIQTQLDDQAKSDAISAISAKFILSPDKLSKCTGFSDLFKIYPVTDSAPALAEWLVDGGHIYSTGSRSGANIIESTTGTRDASSQRVFTDDEETLVKTCLTTEYGAELLELIASAGGSATAPSTTTGATSTTDSDVCLSEGDQFSSWFACPLINLLNDAFDKIKVTLQDMLKFSIEDSGAGTASSVNELKNAWNVFRGIASILIIIFFLTALLVKSIKGE